MVVKVVSKELDIERDRDRAWKKEVKERKNLRTLCIRHREAQMGMLTVAGTCL
jgi:hypothetical protein